jgi:hypothetical protein
MDLLKFGSSQKVITITTDVSLAVVLYKSL